MKIPAPIVLLFAPLALILLHTSVHQQTISFFLFPLGMAALLPYLLPNSLTAILVLIIGSELLAATTPGVMTLTIMVPFLIRRLFPETLPGFSLRFLGLIALTTTLQFLVLSFAIAAELLWKAGIPFNRLFISFPTWQIIVAIFTTSAVVFFLGAAWHEWFSLPQKTERGVIKNFGKA